MNLPLGAPLPQNSSTPPTADQQAARQFNMASFGAGILTAQAASAFMVPPETFAGVSPLAPTVVGEAQAIVAQQQLGTGMYLYQDVTEMSGGGAIITDKDLADAPTVVPLNAISEAMTVVVPKPRTPARRHSGVRWANPASYPPIGSTPCPGTVEATVDSSGSSWKWLWILAAVLGGLYVLDDSN